MGHLAMTCTRCGDDLEVDGAIDFVLSMVQAWNEGHGKTCPRKTDGGAASASRANGGDGVRASTASVPDAPAPSSDDLVIEVQIDPEAFTYFPARP